MIIKQAKPGQVLITSHKRWHYLLDDDLHSANQNLIINSKGSNRAGPPESGHLLLCRHAGPEGPAHRGADPDQVCVVTSEIHQHQVWCSEVCTLWLTIELSQQGTITESRRL